VTIRNTSAWFVVNPDGVVLTWTCFTLRWCAIHEFERISGDKWKNQRKLGCRCVRLAIGPEMTKGGA
jgi:hypothetical protein